MEKSNVNRLTFGASLTAKLSSLIIVLLHFYCFIAFYSGVVTISGGELVGFADGFDMIKVITNTFKTLFKGSVGESGMLTLLLPLLHIALLIAVLVNAVNSLVRFFLLFGGEDDKLRRNQKQSFLISRKFIGSGVCMLVFIMLSSWISGTNPTASSWLVIAALSAGVIVSRFANSILIKSPFKTKMAQIAYSIAMLGVVGMIMAFASIVSHNVISDIGTAIDGITASSATALSITADGLAAVGYVLVGFVMLNAVLMVRGCKSFALVPNKRVKNSGKSIFVCTLVAVVLIIISRYLAWKFNFKSLWKFVIRPMLPIILAATAALLFGLIQPKVSNTEENGDEEDEDEAEPEEKKKSPDPEASAEPESDPEPNIVFVGKRVKKIKAKKYKNRKDIDVIVIPASVNYVEGYSFYGCTSLKEIHCERKSQTRFWHKKWNYGCPAKVIWDSADVGEK